MSEVLFERISEDRKARLLKDEHEMHLHNIASIKEEARKEGIAEGSIETRKEDILKTASILESLGIDFEIALEKIAGQYSVSADEIRKTIKEW